MSLPKTRNFSILCSRQNSPPSCDHLPLGPWSSLSSLMPLLQQRSSAPRPPVLRPSACSGTRTTRFCWVRPIAYLIIPNVSSGSISNYEMRASNSFSGAISSNSILTVTGTPQCVSIPWQTGLKLGTNGLRTSITYSNGTTRAVLNMTNSITLRMALRATATPPSSCDAAQAWRTRQAARCGRLFTPTPLARLR